MKRIILTILTILPLASFAEPVDNMKVYTFSIVGTVAGMLTLMATYYIVWKTQQSKAMRKVMQRKAVANGAPARPAVKPISPAVSMVARKAQAK